MFLVVVKLTEMYYTVNCTLVLSPTVCLESLDGLELVF